jgi:dTMP kinase
MAGEAGTSVGVITLDLRIVSKIAEQLDAIAATANKSAQQSFGDLGKAVEEAISKPVEKAGKTMEEAITAPVENAQKVVQDTLQKTQDQTDKTMDQINAAISAHHAEAQKLLQEKVSLPETAPHVPSATASEIYKRQGKDVDTSGHAANAPPDLSDTFLPAVNGAELLRQKMANVQMQFDSEREKLAALNAEFAKVATGSEAWDELSAKITAAEGRLISLQSTLNATQAKIDAPAQKAAASAEKAAAAQERAAQKAAAAQERAQQRAAAAEIGRASCRERV